MQDTARTGTSTYSSAVEPPADHRPLILHLFEQQGQTAEDALRNFDWFYGGHAFQQLHLQVLRHHAGDSDEAVGVVSMVSRGWHCQGRELELALLGNLVVDQHHRSLGPAVKLLRETLATVEQAVDYCYLLPNPSTK